MSRKIDREICYQMLFSTLFLNENDVDFDKELLLATEEELKEDSKEYIKNTFFGVIKKRAEIEAIIEKHLNGYSLQGLYKTDLTGLMLAVYELKFNADIPQKVVVNEIVEICKKFSNEKSSKFVNGVLASILKELNNEWKYNYGYAIFELCKANFYGGRAFAQYSYLWWSFRYKRFTQYCIF